jgi:hypothetical protein
MQLQEIGQKNRLTVRLPYQTPMVNVISKNEKPSSSRKTFHPPYLFIDRMNLANAISSIIAQIEAIAIVIQHKTSMASIIVAYLLM